MTFKKTLTALLVLISFILCSSGTLAVYTKQLSRKNVLQMPYHIKTDKTLALDTPALAPAVPSPGPCCSQPGSYNGDESTCHHFGLERRTTTAICYKHRNNTCSSPYPCD
ncbi:hypothetical protein LI159_03550 [Eubacterium callanderi]|uniref:hypothetical protein n=1 Tax=Eubacterium callanderi TaxID=53442 RepID=UPI001D06C0BB|nr:hypothetical protein [Eubacterium callanderi]MCB6658170.1 hypothetical protein [Eubacterium callanderi]